MRQRLPVVIAISAALLLIWLSEDEPPSSPSTAAAKPERPKLVTAPAATIFSSRAKEVGPVATAGGDAPGRNEVTLEEFRRALDDPESRDRAIQQLLPELFARDPVSVLLFVDSIADPETRAPLVRAVASRWARRDPQQALDWARSLAVEDDRDTALTQIFSQIAESDPAEAVRLRQTYVNDLPIDPELENLVQRWAEKNFVAALQWSDSLPLGEQRDLVVARAAFVQAQQSPADAIQLVMDRMTEGPAQTEMLISVLHQWALRDYAAASTWAAQLPPSALSDRAALELAAVSPASRRGE